MEKEKKYKGKKIVQLKEPTQQPTQYVVTIVAQSVSVWRILRRFLDNGKREAGCTDLGT
jgi:hypothetical protein